MLNIVPIVEGDGDIGAFSALLSKIIHGKYQRYDVSVAQGKGQVVKANGRGNLENKLDKFLGHAQNRPNCGAILVLVDSDSDCPVTLAQELYQRSAKIGSKYPVEVVCANPSYESWLLASLDTIRGKCGISADANLTCSPEDVPNPKQWISETMPRGKAYKETIHQTTLSRAIDVCLAHKNSRSFRRLCHAVEELLDF